MAWYSLYRISVFVSRETFCTECDTLIQCDVIPDDTSLPYHDTGSMIYIEIFSYLSPRMNIYPCLKMGKLTDNSRYERYLHFI